MQKPGVIATYTYDEQGLRTKKTLLGAGTTAYYYQGGMLLGESRSNGVNLVYYYDEQGLPYRNKAAVV